MLLLLLYICSYSTCCCCYIYVVIVHVIVVRELWPFCIDKRSKVWVSNDVHCTWHSSSDDLVYDCQSVDAPLYIPEEYYLLDKFLPRPPGLKFAPVIRNYVLCFTTFDPWFTITLILWPLVYHYIDSLTLNFYHTINPLALDLPHHWSFWLLTYHTIDPFDSWFTIPLFIFVLDILWSFIYHTLLCDHC